MLPRARLTLLAGCLVMALANAAPAIAETTAQAMPEYMDMLGHAIAMQTVEGKDQVPAFARYLAGKLESAGFAKSDIQIIPVGHTAALVVHYRGSGKGKPILISAHMDVVAANADGWTDHDPFKLVKDGPYYYGRGVADMKDNTVALVATFMRLKREGFVPGHAMILVFSGDEETDMASTRELAKRYHDAEFLLNGDAGGGTYDAKLKPVMFEVQAAEKTYADFQLTATSKGGHSSEPSPDNAIYKLAGALQRVAAYPFPVKYNKITLASFKAIGEHGSGKLAEAARQFTADPGNARAVAVISADPAYVGQIRTTCAATMLGGGHALNALPERATANVNCRIFPGTSVASVQAALVKAVANPAIEVSVRMPPPVTSPASPLRPDVMAAVATTVHERFPGLDIVPGMSSGATDSMYFRNAGVPCYGIDPNFSKPGDAHAHGYNERLLATEPPAGLDFWHSLLTKLTK
ncbi:MAG: M20/M25/M40 family metallo-hydrolase [Rhodanobacteraceae bacterium]|nr:MAG: M20/M25/M40 family metallo-hydrolase [Rhodanobacteraceae bacterium]